MPQFIWIPHTTTFKFCRQAHLLNKLLMSKINLHISSNFFKLLCIGKRCFQPEVAKSSHIMCFMNWAPMLVQIFPWTGVSDYQKLHLLAPATADKFLIEKHMNKLIWRNLWMMLFSSKYSLVSINRPVRIADPMGLEDKNYLLTHSNCRPDGKAFKTQFRLLYIVSWKDRF